MRDNRCDICIIFGGVFDVLGPCIVFVFVKYHMGFVVRDGWGLMNMLLLSFSLSGLLPQCPHCAQCTVLNVYVVFHVYAV